MSVVFPPADAFHLAAWATVVPDVTPAGCGGDSVAEDADVADTDPGGGATTLLAVLNADEGGMSFHWSTKDLLFPTLLLSSVNMFAAPKLRSSWAESRDSPAQSASKMTFLLLAGKEVPTGAGARKGVATDLGDDGHEVPPPALAEDDAHGLFFLSSRLCSVKNLRRESTLSFDIPCDIAGVSTGWIRSRPVGLGCERTPPSFDFVRDEYACDDR